MPDKQKRRRGRPSYDPTPSDRRYVRRMVANGLSKVQVAAIVGISTDTLYKYFPEELATAAAKANHKVASALYRGALNGSVRAQIFWLRARAGWKYTDVFEHTGPEGGPIEINDARQKLVDLVERTREAALNGAHKEDT